MVSLRDDAGNAITGDTLTVTSSGPGLLGTGIGSPSGFSPAGHSISVTVSSVVSDKYVFGLFGDGTGGFSTITIFDGTSVLATKFAAFYGPVAFLTAIQNLFVVDIAGGAFGSNSSRNPADGTYVNTPAVILTARDANGVPVPDERGVEFSAVSSDLSVLSSAINVIEDDSPGSQNFGAYNVQIRSASGGVSGKSATLTFRYSDDRVKNISTPPVVFTTASSTIANVSMSFDKKTYGPGDHATVTINATDASGNPVSAQDSGNFFASSTGLSTSAQITQMLFPFTTVTLMKGKATASFDLPTTSGPFTLNGRLGNGVNLSSTVQGLSVSAMVTILTRQDVEIAAARDSAAASERAASATFMAVTTLTALVRGMMAILARIQKLLHLR